MSRLRQLLLVTALSGSAAVLSACGSQVWVRAAWDKSADFGGYHSFAMAVDNRPIAGESAEVDPFVLQRLRQLVYAELKRKGLRPVERAEADLICVVLTDTQRRVAVRHSSYASPYMMRAGPAFYTEVYEYEEGRVVLDLVDRQRDAVVFRGTGLRPADGAGLEQALGETVAQILSHYPPRAK